MVRVVFQTGVVHVGDTLILNQPCDNLLSVRQVRVHALRQGLNTLQQVERGLRAQRRAEVTQLLRTQLSQETELTEVTPPGHAVVGGNRLGHGREVAVTPVETTGLDDDTAEGGAVTAQELGDRVNDDVRAVLDGADQVGGGQGCVHDQGDARLVCDLCEAFQVGNLTGGVRHDLGVDRLGVLGQGRLVVGGVGAGHEGGLNAEAAQGHVQLGDGAAVQLGRCHNVVALLTQSGEGDELGSHAGGGRYRTDAAFEGGDALLQCGDGRVGQARVDVAVLLQGEEVRGVVSVFEDEGGSLVDRDRAGTVFSVGGAARV